MGLGHYMKPRMHVSYRSLQGKEVRNPLKLSRTFENSRTEATAPSAMVTKLQNSTILIRKAKRNDVHVRGKLLELSVCFLSNIRQN